jgi:hypothetical protein
MILTTENFIQFAMKNYENSQCFSLKEFETDLNRFDYLNKLFYRYSIDSTDLRERLILNHIIVLYNVFGDFTYHMLLFKINTEYKSVLITFLVYLNRISDNEIVDNLDQIVIEVLRKI